MKINYKVMGIAIVLVAIISAIALSSVPSAKANPIYFPLATRLASATTSPSYLTAGTATTTMQIDSYTNGVPTAIQKGTALINFTGSSTASVLNMNIEYSQDAIDWYGNDISASTTPLSVTDISSVNSYKFTFASTTVGGLGGVTGTSTKAVGLDIPTRYARLVFTMPTGSAGGAVWVQFIPRKEFGTNN